MEEADTFPGMIKDACIALPATHMGTTTNHTFQTRISERTN